jgi:hypothetical protein
VSVVDALRHGMEARRAETPVVAKAAPLATARRRTRTPQTALPIRTRRLSVPQSRVANQLMATRNYQIAREKCLLCTGNDSVAVA